MDGSQEGVETEDHQEEGVGETGKCTSNYLITSSAVFVLSAQIAVNVSMFAGCQMHQVVGGVAMLTPNL